MTPFHLITFGSGALSLATGNMRLSPDMFALVGMWKRINALLVLYAYSLLYPRYFADDVRLLVVHNFLMGAMRKYNHQITEISSIKDLNKDLARRAKVAKKPTDWVS